MPDHLDEVPRPRAGTSRSPATPPTRRTTELADAIAPRARRAPAGRDRRAVPDARSRCASTATSPPTSSTRRSSSPSAAASRCEELDRDLERTAATRLRLVSDGDAADAAQPAPAAAVRRAAQPRAGPELPRRLQHPRRHRARRRARPRRRLPGDRRRARRAVRAPGAALRARARRRGRPRRWSRRCATRWTRTPTSTLHLADAMALDLAALRARARRRSSPTCPTGSPPPSCCARSRSCRRRRRWVAMVQKEVGERLAAAAGVGGLRHPVGDRPAGVPTCASCVASRARVFHPGAQRRLGARRRAPHRARPRRPALRALVQQAFAHRRKALARSLSLAAGARPGDPRRRPRRAGGARASRPTRAPSAWRPQDFRAPVRAPGGRRDRCVSARPRKINLCLFLGPTRPADGRHELVSVMQSLTLADDLALQPAAPAPAPTRSSARASRGRTSPPPRWPPSARRPAGTARRCASRSPSACPVAGGHGRRLGRRRRRAAPDRRARRPGRVDEALLLRLAAGLGADVPAQVRPGRVAGHRRGRARAAPARRPAATACSSCPGTRALSTAAVYARGRPPGPRRATPATSPRAWPRSTDALERHRDLPPHLLVNDLEPAALALAPEIDGALGEARDAGADVAMVSGSGPTVLGLFLGPHGPRRAQAAARLQLDGRGARRAGAAARAGLGRAVKPLLADRRGRAGRLPVGAPPQARPRSSWASASSWRSPPPSTRPASSTCPTSSS